MSGPDRFVADLQTLGFRCVRFGPLVVVTLDVATAAVPGVSEVGADPPGDFPLVPPHWLHLRSNLVLPQGGARASELGPEWRKWSRPHPRWRGGSNGAREWLAHARSLLLTARAA